MLFRWKDRRYPAPVPHCLPSWKRREFVHHYLIESIEKALGWNGPQVLGSSSRWEAWSILICVLGC
jgi:hypothetical protein